MVIFALFAVVLFGFVALSVDAGFLMAERRQAQSAADGAAMAADKAYQRNEFDDIVPTGVQYAQDNGFDAGEVAIEPLASYTTDGGVSYVKCVRATVTHDVTQFFLGAIYSGDWQVSATGVACTEDEPREYALIALDPDGDGIRAGGTADVVISNGGGAMSNADSDFCGSVQWLQAQGPLDAYDGIDICNNANVVSLPPNPSAAQIPDPLEDVAEPNCGTLPVYDDTNPSVVYPDLGWEPDVDVRASDPDEQRYKPGNYPDGISIKNEHEVFFDPGLYCLGGDGLALSAGSSQDLDVVGDDVMFYLYDDAPVDIDGQGVNVDVSNLDGNACGQDACQAGVIIFYSRGLIAAQPEDCSELVLNGNVVTVAGIFYAPCSEIRLEGNGDLTVSGQMLGASIYVRGGNAVLINYVTDLVIEPAQVYLVE
jgi:hypothetical protein